MIPFQNRKRILFLHCFLFPFKKGKKRRRLWHIRRLKGECYKLERISGEVIKNINNNAIKTLDYSQINMYIYISIIFLVLSFRLLHLTVQCCTSPSRPFGIGSLKNRSFFKTFGFWVPTLRVGTKLTVGSASTAQKFFLLKRACSSVD